MPGFLLRRESRDSNGKGGRKGVITMVLDGF